MFPQTSIINNNKYTQCKLVAPKGVLQHISEINYQ